MAVWMLKLLLMSVIIFQQKELTNCRGIGFPTDGIQTTELWHDSVAVVICIIRPRHFALMIKFNYLFFSVR